MAFPKKISELPKAGSIKNSDLFVLVHDGVTSQVRFDRLIFSADSNTFITGGTLTGTNLILEKNNNVDVSPIDLSALSGATFSWSDPTVTGGNTSGDCISQLWVSTISGCSPVVIGPELIVNGKFTMNGDLDLCSGGTLYVSAISGCSPVVLGPDLIVGGEIKVGNTIISSSGITISGKSTEFTGNTSGTCINEIWVSTLLGCSPMTIGESIQSPGATASGLHSIAYGGGNIASGITSQAFGDATKALNTSAHAEGHKTMASGLYSHAEGNDTLASGQASHAEGEDTLASGDRSHAEGETTIGSGGNAHAEGRETIASGSTSHAEGYLSIAGGIQSHAEGWSSKAWGINSHAEGESIAHGTTSHSEGRSQARGDYSHSQGSFTQAIGTNSHSGGINANASGETSFIHSTNSLVTGDRSAIIGGQNITGAANDTVYVPNLNIGTIGGGTPVSNLGIDASGFVVTGTDSGDTNTFVTGGTLTNTDLTLKRSDGSNTSAIDLSALSGEWSAGTGTNIYYDLGGVGIGIDDPDEELHVYASGNTGVKIESKDGNAFLILDSDGAKNTYIDYKENSSRKWRVGSHGSSDDHFRWATGDTFNTDSVLDLTKSGDLTVKGDLDMCNGGTLYVSNISGCSPVTISSDVDVVGSLSATTFFGDGSGLDGVQANIPFTTLTPGATVAWDFNVAGENTKLTPDSGATAPNEIVPTNFPNGAHGYLLIDASNTIDFKLPTNSLITNGLVAPSEGSETKYSYIYDGTTFYWSIENNLIVPLYSTWSTTNLVSDYDPASYGGAGGDVADGTTWLNSYTNNNLIGDLTKDGDPDDIQFVLADIPSETPAHWEFEDANTNAAWHRPSNLSPTAFAGSWNGTVWLQNRGTTTTWQGLIDGESDDQDVMYIEDNRPTFQEGGLTSIYSNFPELINNSTTQNYNLADEWIYFSLSCDEAANTVTFVIGCQLTMDNANGTIEGFDGSLISIESDGTYVETVAATVSAIAWTSCAVGSAANNVWDFRGRMGQVAIYNTNISSAIQRENWERTRDTYYIT